MKLALGSGYTETGGTAFETYRYAVRQRHLALTSCVFSGFDFETFVGLGLDNTIVTGLASLLPDTKHYNPIDVLYRSNTSSNLVERDQLAELLQVHASFLDDAVLPSVYPRREFCDLSPSGVTEAVTEVAQRPSHGESLKRDLAGADGLARSFAYAC